MGNFYVNHTVRAPQDRVVAVLEREGRTAYVGPTKDGYTTVYDRECDHQNTYAVTDLGEKLSTALGSPVVAFLNHDDDVLCYWVFDKGQVVEEYNSCPDYFDEEDYGDLVPDAEDDDGPGLTTDGTQLCRLFGRPGARSRVRSILEDPGAMFVVMTHEQLVQALGLPEWVVGTGYRYIAKQDAGIGPDECVHVAGHGGNGRRLRIADFGDED